ncbi:5-carboxymethyl-2-hydroxymuconate isomerase [Siminovitchia terrae]|uniref:5-carboxymethyl-2-hydroxymuconate Delta-isomerase n=1 Tax=Siminovitchia terrae TaxID=1914933 RepID=A0A429X4W4_SIMTE|nr:5-carboxymethyl-2-hydroxymuconate Delta-isomerase [Siminovitchia terrae]RST58422.1 5-carboxymethyl-2-hydroxymuconate Delta-isomerase [Siminovitchia terrae]GIN94017.1 5-carboxymethyl-2-hydroxymuconate isomerase [Siminovitchia terrae]GIN96780.1 5-carboxymethyl-2-hydroxymuconate isomerase [Siminovitchia terrae]
MPHVIVEYTDNIKEEAHIEALLKKINQSLIDSGGVFPIAGIRSRAIELKDYFVADGSEDDAFVHVALKIGGGRSEQELTKACDKLFEMIKEHFADLFEKRYLALSMEVEEFSRPTYKQNNIHKRYKK